MVDKLWNDHKLLGWLCSNRGKTSRIVQFTETSDGVGFKPLTGSFLRLRLLVSGPADYYPSQQVRAQVRCRERCPVCLQTVVSDQAKASVLIAKPVVGRCRAVGTSASHQRELHVKATSADSQLTVSHRVFLIGAAGNWYEAVVHFLELEPPVAWKP